MGDGVANGGSGRGDTLLELTKTVLRVSMARLRGKVMQITDMTVWQSGRNSTAKSHIDVAHALTNWIASTS